MQNNSSVITVLGTGGTIAGVSCAGRSDTDYRAAQIGIVDLLAQVPGLMQACQGASIEAEQVAQVDSKDMSWEVCWRLVQRLRHALARPEVTGAVVTHGTDTLEETAYFLHRVLTTDKPVVLTAAMRPATSAHADGPANLCQAVQVAVQAAWGGVAVVLHAEVHDPIAVRKVHPRAVRAFSSGKAGPLAVLRQGVWRWRRSPSVACEAIPLHDGNAWPWVEVLHSYTGARAQAVSSWSQAGVQGLVVVTTGNGTVHHELESALRQAHDAGVVVWRCSRFAHEGLLPDAASWWPTSPMPAPQTRIALMLHLLTRP